MHISRFETRVEIMPHAAFMSGVEPAVEPAVESSAEEAAALEAAAAAGVEQSDDGWPTPEEAAAADLEFRRRVTFLLDGAPLIDLVRVVERPFAERQWDERVAAGQSPNFLGPRGGLAGRYTYLPPYDVFLPSRNLLGAEYYHDYDLKPGDRRRGKSVLLHCCCGVSVCGDLLAMITVSDDTVTWSDFCHCERNWTYDLGPFVFDRAQYESQLVPPDERPGGESSAGAK